MTEANKRHITKNQNWVLMLKGIYRRFTEQKAVITIKPQQDFCLMITIKDPTGTLNVYNETIQKLDAFQFWHNSLNISSRVIVRA